MEPKNQVQKPFFAQFVEGQTQETQEQQDVQRAQEVTLKFPSDWDDEDF